MSVKDQLQKLKDNWLLIVIAVLVIFLLLGGSSLFNTFSGISSFESVNYDSLSQSDFAKQKNAYYQPSSYPLSGYPYPRQDFAPEENKRKITKQTDIASEIERGTFKQSESRLINIVTSSDSFLLNQNVNRYGKDKKSYYIGTYYIKVDTKKYDSVVAQLRGIGEVISFRESQSDITGDYKNINIEIQTEKSRLKGYRQLLNETQNIDQKIQLTDKIFEQERNIKYLEDSLANMDKTVEYSTITLTLNEKISEYLDIVFVKFSELAMAIVTSLNLLLKFIFLILPWLVVLWLIVFFRRRIFIKSAKK